MSERPLWRSILPNWPVIGVVVLAFVCGKFGFSILLLPVLLYFFLKIERSWRRKEVAAELKEKLTEDDMRRMLLSESTESVIWLNRTLLAMWPHLDRWLSASLRSMLIRTFAGLNQPDEQGKPKSIQLDVLFVSFGTQPIKIDGITAKPASGLPYSTRLDLDFSYRGDVTIDLQAKLPFGMKVPVSLKDLEMLGKLKVELSFKDKGSIKHCSLCFLTPPTLNFSIRTLGRLDIMDLPSLKETINTIIVSQMRSLMTYPNSLTFDWSGAQNAQEDTQTPEERAHQRQKFVYETVSLDESPTAQDVNPLSDPLSMASHAPSTPSQTSPNKFSDIPSSASRPDSASSLTSTPQRTNNAQRVNDKPATSISPSGPPSSSLSSSRAKPMQSFAKRSEDLNEFLLMSPEEFRGTLSVRVVECLKLHTSDIFSVNPYVSLEMNGVSFATEVVKRTSSPAWNNAVFEFPVPRYLPSKGLFLRLQVLDKTKIGSDDSLGHTSISIDRFLKQPDEVIFLNEPLVGAASGRISLQIKYVVES